MEALQSSPERAVTAGSRAYDKWQGVDGAQFYPIQASAKGGIGQVLATGGARSGKSLLYTDDMRAGASCKSTVMGVSGKFSAFEPDASYFKYAAREWEGKVQARTPTPPAVLNKS